MKMRMWLFAATLLGTGLGAGVWLGSGSEAKSTVPSRGAPLLTVSVVQAEHKALADAIEVVGVTRSRENVLVIPELPGLRVLTVQAEVGDHVRAGQTLATLDGESLDIALDELRSEFERTRGEYDRVRTLSSQQLVSQEFAKQKLAAFEVARSRYQNARLSVARTRVVAPAAGLVYHRTAAIGGLTDGSVSLFEIAKDGEVEMAASVPEALVARLTPGMRASVRVVGRAAPITGEIRLVTPNVDSLSRAAEVRIRLPSEEGLPVGAFGQVRVELARVQGWTVPRSALQQDAGGSYVWRVDGKGQVSRQAITPTLQTADAVSVAESLEGLRIVAKAGAFLHERDRVLIAAADTRR